MHIILKTKKNLVNCVRHLLVAICAVECFGSNEQVLSNINDEPSKGVIKPIPIRPNIIANCDAIQRSIGQVVERWPVVNVTSDSLIQDPGFISMAKILESLRPDELVLHSDDAQFNKRCNEFFGGLEGRNEFLCCLDINKFKAKIENSSAGQVIYSVDQVSKKFVQTLLYLECSLMVCRTALGIVNDADLSTLNDLCMFLYHLNLYHSNILWDKINISEQSCLHLVGALSMVVNNIEHLSVVYNEVNRPQSPFIIESQDVNPVADTVPFPLAATQGKKQLIIVGTRLCFPENPTRLLSGEDIKNLFTDALSNANKIYERVRNISANRPVGAS